MKKKYKIIGETEKTVTFIYGGTECCYAKSCYSSIEEVIKEIEAQRATMRLEERTGWDEADRAVFERWQDEANTNMYLDGIIYEDEDPDFNPFRKDDK